MVLPSSVGVRLAGNETHTSDHSCPGPYPYMHKTHQEVLQDHRLNHRSNAPQAVKTWVGQKGLLLHLLLPLQRDWQVELVLLPQPGHLTQYQNVP